MGNIDPIPDYQMPGMTPKASASQVEQKSFQTEAEAFYLWYQSVRQPTSPTEGYKGLQYIMQIGEKGTATKEEAITASKELRALMDDLEGGKKTLDQIPYEIEKIVDHLIENNPRNRIVMQATQIEIAVNLSKLETPDEFKEMMQSLLKKVNPEMPNIQAEAISHILKEGLKSQDMNMKDLKGKLFPLLK